ncbi:hypothetical protein BBP40_004579 [Aspergillus hancockii]|nr:hypothetical protein BBP40_004579 [Aspergillus hancockii]
MLWVMVDTVARVLKYYEIAMETVANRLIEAREARQAGNRRHGEGASPSASEAPGTGSSPIVNGSESSASHSHDVVITVPSTYIGLMQLDEQETSVVARETLHHATMRLGEMLKDLEEDTSQCGAGPRERVHDSERDVRLIMSRLLRLLGRINSMSQLVFEIEGSPGF